MVRTLARLACYALLMLTWARATSWAWDVLYEGDVLPSYGLSGMARWATDADYGYYSDTVAADGILHLIDNRVDKGVSFYREGTYLPAGTDMTIEARVKIVSATAPAEWDIAAWFGASVEGGQGAFVALRPGSICTAYDGTNYMQVYSMDMTQFHVLRIAANSADHQFSVWVDGTEAFHGATWSGYAGGAFFGTGYHTTTLVDSYWDYVRYSKQFIPIPEPSSLLALCAGIGTMGAVIRRRRR